LAIADAAFSFWKQLTADTPHTQQLEANNKTNTSSQSSILE
jgi:hypothetical protein